MKLHKKKVKTFPILFSGTSRFVPRFVFMLLTGTFLGAAIFNVAQAQSPAPTLQMGDAYPGNAFPVGSSAVAVEGLGSLACSYPVSRIESSTVAWTALRKKVVTEISPQSACGTISQYETLISTIRAYVVTYGTNPGAYWAGFMLDEEPGFGFSASQLQTLNAYVQAAMVATPGLSWYFEENQPNGWLPSTYHAILANSWPAPQAYTSSMVSAINAECKTYSNCNNLVTVDSYLPNPWSSPSYVTGLVNGGSWTNSYWGTGSWFNNWTFG